MHVAILGTYRPIQCGIATFTADVESSLRLAGVDVTVVPVVPAPIDRTDLDRPYVVRDDVVSYVAAARALDGAGVDVVLVQHEFGIFGGEAGSHVVEFVGALTVPYAVTLHTVLPRFTAEQTAVVHRLCGGAAVVTVFTESARRLLIDQELATASMVRVVPHGAPAELYADVDPVEARRLLGLPASGPVMSTFGLLSPGKGIETAIHAMELLRSEHPDLRYVVAGRTHPEVARRDGERYRHCLEALADDLGVGDRVVFIDRFLDLGELAALLGVSDVVCTPYRGEEQSVSGVLTFALASGCPIVSTPYRYARDVLADGAGIIVDFDDDEGIADAVHGLLEPEAGRAARDAARRVAARMPWPTVGASLRDVLMDAAHPAAAQPLLLTANRPPAPAADELGTSHLPLLCDDTAIIQHAHLIVPRLEDGYCVDDAARALPVLDRLAAAGDRSLGTSVGRMLAFLRSAAHGGEPGAMRNLMSFERRWLDGPHVGDHVGRAVWGLGELVAGDGPYGDTGRSILEPLARAVSPAWPTKTLAYSLLGLVAASPTGSSEAIWDDAIERCLPTVRGWAPAAGRWAWFEPRLDYDHARIPEVLLRVGHHVGEPELVDRGAALLTWLDALCLQGDHYRFPGHRGLTDVKELRWSGDEQPLEASALADAQATWFRLSGEPDAAHAVERAWSWFLGNNRLGEPILDLHSGAGRDGLGSHEVNRNCGAESTLAAHRCAITWRAVAASLTEPTSNGSVRVHA